MVHPVQSVIESLYAAGRCPRLHVNALFEDVSCPDFIREQWRERLIIDLDPSYPLDLTFEEDGLGADLSFGGYVTRCSFPYGAVYVVADRSTGRGIVLDQNMPDSVKRTRYGRAGGDASSPEPSKPALRPVSAEPDPEPEAETPEGETATSGGSELNAAPTAEASDSRNVDSVTDGKAGASADAEAAAGSGAAADAAAVGKDTGKSDEPEADTEQVQKRRAAFRVIDGGS
ncbi:MAG: ClpXP protease specificity-enhancing factor SspB [Nannocystales bacterium]